MDRVESTNARWCLGLRSTGTRALELHELELVAARYRAERQRLWLPAALAAAGPAAVYLSYLVHGDGPEPALPILIAVVTLMIAGLFLPGAALLLCRDRVRAWRAVRRDLAAGVVEHFTDPDSREPTLCLGNNHNIPLVTLDLLPISGAVLWLNDAPPPRPLQADIYEAAARPEVPCYALPAAVAAALPPDMLAAAEIDRRRLSRTELAEIGRHVAAARRPSPTMIACGVWVALGLCAAYSFALRGEIHDGARQYGPLFLLAALFAGLQLYQHTRLRRLAARLEADREDAWVLVAREKRPDASFVELLPHSRLPWSYAGDPAAWRLAKAGAREASPTRIAVLTHS